MQIILVQKLQFLFWRQIIEAVTEEINFLLYEPASKILPLTKHFIQLHAVSFVSVENCSIHLRLAVGKSKNEVWDVVLPSFLMFTHSILVFSVILDGWNEVQYFNVISPLPITST